MNLTNEFIDRNVVSLDAIDLKIIDLLCRQGRLSISELAKSVGLSKSPVQLRVKRLEQQGIILGYCAVVDPVRLGLDHISFVEVTLSDTREPAIEDFNQAAMNISEIEQIHMVASRFDYLLKVRTRDMKSYRHVLGQKISMLPHVSHTSTHVAMQAVKESGVSIDGEENL